MLSSPPRLDGERRWGRRKEGRGKERRGKRKGWNKSGMREWNKGKQESTIPLKGQTPPHWALSPINDVPGIESLTHTF